MGKGKRNREQRTNIWAVHRGGGGGVVPRSALLDVDDVTATTLGAEGLADLEANLWPVDCQSCGRGLGSTRPSVFVFDMLTHASASLHHRQCRRPEWSTSHLLPGSADPHLSWTAQSFLLPVTAGERRDDRPLLVVNPSLEQVGLRRGDDGRWAVSTVEFFRRLGLRTPGRDFVIDRPIPDGPATTRPARSPSASTTTRQSGALSPPARSATASRSWRASRSASPPPPTRTTSTTSTSCSP